MSVTMGIPVAEITMVSTATTEFNISNNVNIGSQEKMVNTATNEANVSKKSSRKCRSACKVSEFFVGI